MSTMEEPQVSRTVDSVGSRGPSPIDRLRRHAGPVALAAGSVLTIAGMALHVEGDGSEADVEFVRTVEAQSTQWLASHLLLAAGMALMAGGAVAVFRMARGRGAALTAVGAGAMAVGGVLMSLGDLAHGALAYALSGHVDPATSLEIQESYFFHPAVAVISFGGMLLPLGVVVLGIALLRSRAVPRWAAVVLMISPILISVGFASGTRMLVLGIPFVMGLVILARAIARWNVDGRPTAIAAGE
jgi:hypothetical protein